MGTAQKLTALDASFLHLESPTNHMHIGGIAIFGPSPLGTGAKLYKGLVKAIEPRLDLVPRYRQKVALVPLSLDVPVWVDDANFDIENHVLRAALPKPGGDRELQNLAARVFSRPLDRRRPLWEIYIVEGLPEGKWALLTKTHHALVDGISSLELVTVLLDTDPEVAGNVRKSSWTPKEAPSSLDLVVESLRDKLARPGRLISTVRGVVEKRGQIADALRDTASGIAVMAQTLRNPSSTVLNGSIGPSRKYTYSRFPLEDFRTVKNHFGATINDVVLASVAGGLRNYLELRGVDPEDKDEALQALCPVSIRDTSEKSAMGNRLAMLLVKLPIDEPDPAKRMARVKETVDNLKERKQAVAADFLMNLAGFSPATLHAMVARSTIRQIGFNLVVTNVPGPQFPLYFQGARLIEAFPIAFLYDKQRVAIAIFSYCGWLNFGYIVDAQGIRDVNKFAKSVEHGFQELLDAAQESTAADDASRLQRA
jgi:WS/DGAT/MGAT family acyltransferase